MSKVATPIRTRSKHGSTLNVVTRNSSVRPTSCIRSKHGLTLRGTTRDSGVRVLRRKRRNELFRVIRYDVAVYPLRHIILGYALPSPDKERLYRFQSNKFIPLDNKNFPPIYGSGRTIDEAKEDWKREFHQRFEKLSTQLPWERTGDDITLWNIIQKIVNVPEYRRRTPVRVQHTGKIVENNSISSNKRMIEWLDESQDVVDFKDCPQLLVYKTGEYFYADLLREWRTDKLIKILSITASKYKELDKQESIAFLDSLPTTKDLSPSIIWK